MPLTTKALDSPAGGSGRQKDTTGDLRGLVCHVSAKSREGMVSGSCRAETIEEAATVFVAGVQGKAACLVPTAPHSDVLQGSQLHISASLDGKVHQAANKPPPNPAPGPVGCRWAAQRARRAAGSTCGCAAAGPSSTCAAPTR